MRIELKFWQSGPLLRSVANILGAMWSSIGDALEKLAGAVDAEHCPEELLHLIAWQRGVERLPGEEPELFRRRTRFALANALDAGSVSGFARIWERLGLGAVIQTERADADDWDVIEVEVSSGVFSRTPGLFEELTRLYGRTCRRYILTVRIAPAVIRLRSFCYDADITITTARIDT